MSDNQKVIAAAMRRLELLKKRDAFDPSYPESRPTTAQLEIIKDFGRFRTQWIVAANRAGKTQTCGRNISWTLTDSHPQWKLPEEWKREGLLIVAGGRKSSHIEETLWPSIRNFLEPGSYKEVRIGNMIQRVEIDNPSGPPHRLIFQSMENVNVARERLQSYTAHIAWLDEMVESVSAIAEMQLRVATKGGFFMASFTPLKFAPAVRKLVDSADGIHSKKYVLRTLDNPVFQDPDRRAALLSSFEGMPEWEVRTRLEGEWATGEENVYHFDYDLVVEQPQDYSPLWRHVMAVDPAMSGASGLVVAAENPTTSKWYFVLAEYLKGVYTPSELVSLVHSKTKHFNIVRRICDPHEVWFLRTAGSMGYTFMGVHKKNERKNELIKQLQTFLNERGRISPNCDLLTSELQECRWSDRADNKIVNATSYHLCDAAQYLVDVLPKPEKTIQASSWDEYLYKANEERKLKVEKERQIKEKRRMLKVSRKSRAWR